MNVVCVENIFIFYVEQVQVYLELLLLSTVTLIL